MPATIPIIEIFSAIEQFTSKASAPITGFEHYSTFRENTLKQSPAEISMEGVFGAIQEIYRFFNLRITWTLGFTPNPPPVTTIIPTIEIMRASAACMLIAMTPEENLGLLHLVSAEDEENVVFQKTSDGKLVALNAESLSHWTATGGYYHI